MGPTGVPRGRPLDGGGGVSYRGELAGLVVLPDPMACDLDTFARRLALAIREEQAKPLPDNHLIALLCDAARLGDEFLSAMREFGG